MAAAAVGNGGFGSSSAMDPVPFSAMAAVQWQQQCNGSSSAMAAAVQWQQQQAASS